MSKRILLALALALGLSPAFASDTLPLLGAGGRVNPSRSLVPVALDSNGTSTQTSNTTSISSSSLTVSAGCGNCALIAVLDYAGIAASAFSCTWDVGGTNQAMTQLGSTVALPTNVGSLQMWGLISPTKGNKTLTCNWTGGASAALSLTSFSGVNQGGSGFSAPVTNTGTSASATVSVTNSGGSLAVDGAACSNDFSSALKTQLTLNNSANISLASSYSTTNGAAGLGWNVVSAPWAEIGVVLKP